MSEKKIKSMSEKKIKSMSESIKIFNCTENSYKNIK